MTTTWSDKGITDVDKTLHTEDSVDLLCEDGVSLLIEDSNVTWNYTTKN